MQPVCMMEPTDLKITNTFRDSIANLLKALESPEKVPKSFNLDKPDKIKEKNEGRLTNLELVRQNPETWVFLCVSYWYTIHRKVYFPNGQEAMPIE